MKVLKRMILLSIFFFTILSSAQNGGKMKKKFGMVDTDNNNKISLEEMITFYKGKKTKKGTPVDAKAMFLGLDSNDDGKLVLKEFIKPVNRKKASEKSKNIKKVAIKQVSLAKTEKLFGLMNTNGDNVISKSEWVKYQEAKAKKLGKPAKNVNLKFLGTDKDNDGKITIQELLLDVDWKLAKQRQKIQ
ncbi:EF-hand domain-containing protein [Flavivirga abyssicola]|uniref:EF-hand domain-containing protein n=1 Tax=Flavivirga abyssicola TaxID=3063533 RepID=UPI0026DF8607|nr:EF-hand domain-containing protein [Flavivirga sp. MEBiC07777]WVK13775.1 EF-hand domain-containing protein [Flavivirga sp. MEBiC07777]